MSNDLILAPVTSSKTISELARSVGQAQAAFDAIRVDYPPQTSAMASLDEIRFAAHGRRSGSPCGGAVLVAPHGCGKTVAINFLKESVGAAAADDQIPILHVEVSTSGTTDSLPTSILTALGVARPDAGTEKIRWPRAVREIERAGVELIVFDEFNRAARRPTMSRAIATAIRERIMDAGLAPVAFVGSEDAGTVLAQTPELLERLDDEIDLSPLNWHVAGDKDLFLSFVNDLDAALVDAGILTCSSELADPATARHLWDASAGRIRRIAKIVRHAMSSAVRDGRGSIHNHDLADAVDVCCIRRNFSTRNPFA